jgi:DNA-binding response OmpR family regulator
MALAKILAVDDDPKILKIVRHCLEKEGFLVFSAGDGEKALAAARVHQPDLVVLDLMLPKVNGLDVARTLITEEHNIPVIILSAKGDELDRIVGLQLGVDDYLPKPFSPAELVLRVKAVLRRIQGAKHKPADPVISCGGVTVDPKTRQVTVDGSPITLTGKEFDLLLLLAGNPRQVFTRMQLLNKIWQSDYEGDENTVTVHVRRLREKLETDPSMPRYIHTVWGVGYKFDCPCS